MLGGGGNIRIESAASSSQQQLDNQEGREGYKAVPDTISNPNKGQESKTFEASSATMSNPTAETPESAAGSMAATQAAYGENKEKSEGQFAREHATSHEEGEEQMNKMKRKEEEEKKSKGKEYMKSQSTELLTLCTDAFWIVLCVLCVCERSLGFVSLSLLSSLLR